MPHVSGFMYEGQKLPSVNEVTGALSQEGLIRNFYRKLGFKKADKVSKEARENGTKLATLFEKYRQTGKTGKVSELNAACVKNWTKWYEEHPFEVTHDAFVEPHLVNTRDMYHGSPDVILMEPLLIPSNEEPSKPVTAYEPVLGDDKLKKRFADYKLIMNEHAYAMCDSFEDPLTKEIHKLPWEPPIKSFWFFTFDPQTGELFPVRHEFQEEVYQDFLTCKAMGVVNRRAEQYFGKYAVLLPTQSQ